MTSFASLLVAALLQAGSSLPPEPDNTVNNHYIVEVRANIGGHWFRLDSGPRSYQEASLLMVGMRKALHGRLDAFRVMCFDLEMQSPIAADTCDPQQDD